MGCFWTDIEGCDEVCATVIPPLAGTYTQLASCPVPLAGHSAAAIDGKMYVFGGYNDTTAALSQLWVYDPATNAWQQLASGPLGRIEHSAAVIDGKMYVFGGNQDVAPTVGLTDLWVYDPATNTWQQLASTSGQYYQVAVVLSAKMFVWGGVYNGTGLDNQMKVYDPSSDTWVITPPGHPMPGITYAAGCAIGGKLYVFGGDEGSGITNHLFVYDPATNEWQQLASGDIALGWTCVAAIGEKMYVFGGYDNTHDRNGLSVYDPVADSWQTLPSGATVRQEHSGVAIDGKMYLLGGWSTALNTTLSDLWVIN